MKLRNHYIILFVFFVVFFISATILLKYSAGYRYNFKKNIWQKTGILILESNPKDASIFLNNELQKEKTPAKIMNLFPGDYLIKLQKSNFFDWQKKLTFNPNLTTFAQNIILFKKDQNPALLLNKDIEYLKLFPNGEKIIFAVKNKTRFDLYVFDLETKKEKFLAYFLPTQLTKINNISFDSFEKKILIEGVDDLKKINFYILNLEQPEKNVSLAEFILLNNFVTINNLELLTNDVNLTEFTEFIQNIQNIKWHPENNKILYGIAKIKNKSSLIQINLNDKKIIRILLETSDILDYYFDKKFIYYLTLNPKNKNIYLKKINVFISNPSLTIAQLPSSSYSFLFSPADILTVLDKENQMLYLISFSNIQSETQKIILEAKDAVWAKDQKKLLYYNDLELWICHLNQEKLKESYQELLGRWSGKISKAVWHPQENYFIFNSDDSIKSIEIDGRDQRNVVALLKSEKIENLFFSTKDKILYFVKDKKLYEIEIY